MNGIICTIYRSSKEAELYLYVKKDTKLEDIPEALVKRLGKAEEAMTLHITADRNLARVDAVKVLESIEEKGFFLQLPPTFSPEVVTFGE